MKVKKRIWGKGSFAPVGAWLLPSPEAGEPDDGVTLVASIGEV